MHPFAGLEGEGQSLEGRLHDLLFRTLIAAKASSSGDRVEFDVLFLMKPGRWNTVVHVLAIMGLGGSKDGEWSRTEVGTPQGAVISPLLANIYLHYFLDQWAHHWRRNYARGDIIITRYAVDFVMGFQHHTEAIRFLAELKTRLIEFGGGRRRQPAQTR